MMFQIISEQVFVCLFTCITKRIHLGERRSKFFCLRERGESSIKIIAIIILNEESLQWKRNNKTNEILSYIAFNKTSEKKLLFLDLWGEISVQYRNESCGNHVTYFFSNFFLCVLLLEIMLIDVVDNNVIISDGTRIQLEKNPQICQQEF